MVEAADGPGGRVRTDDVDGHRLDRGFQILLEAYPYARSMLDYSALDLRRFAPGAMVHVDGDFHRVGDPFREPTRLLETVRAPIGSPVDKARILAFRRSVGKGSTEAIWERPETTARQRLSDLGFSDRMIERFMAPLFAGITLDPDLGGSSRVLEFVFRMLGAGDAAVPATGMGAISDQLAAALPEGSLRLNAPAAHVSKNNVILADGETIVADVVVVATGVTDAAKLAGVEDRAWRGVTSLWLAADEAPLTEPVLILNGQGTEPINSMVVMSQVSDTYAPAGAATIVVSSPTIRPDLVADMRTQLRSWFGSIADHWRELRVDEIEQAQPTQPLGLGQRGAYRTPDGIWICGDHTTDPSINGALASGHHVARELSTVRAA